MKKDAPCACGSGLGYRECCGPRHSGLKPAETAEQLMRSRYCAYALGNANYLVATRHPEFREANELNGIQASLRGLRWKRLEIVATEQGGAEDAAGTVEFRASYTANLVAHVLHERSTFRRENGRWYYCDGEVLPAA
jgi:SEC-C motif-containing protein